MYKFAEIDLETGVCISVSQLMTLVGGPQMILLRDDQDVNPGDVYSGGQWTAKEPETPGTPQEPGTTIEERITLLESDNASLMLQLAESQIKQQEMDQTIAELMLMMAGGQPSV